MTIRSHVSISTLTLFSLLLFSEAIRDVTVKALIPSICNNTPYLDVCKYTLQSDPRSATAADIPALCRIAVDAMAEKANELHAAATEEVGYWQPDYVMWERALIREYATRSSVKTMTEKGVPAAEGGDFHGAYDAVSSVKTDATSCNMWLPEITPESTMLIQLADVTITIIHYLF